MTIVSTQADSLPTFDPAAFLRHFTAVGGGYCINPNGQIWLGYLYGAEDRAARSWVTTIMRQLSPEQIDLVRDHAIALERNDQTATAETSWADQTDALNVMVDNDNALNARFMILHAQYQAEVDALPENISGHDRARLTEEISARLGYGVAEAEWDASVEAVSDARWKLINTPAPNKAALKWKLDYLLEDDGSGGTQPWTGLALSQTRADIERLLGGEA